MKRFQKINWLLLRLALGGLFFFSGVAKILDPTWSARNYLLAAKTFPGFYHWLAGPTLLPWINLVNEWGLTLLGVSLILGIGRRLAAPLGALLMLLYYFPGLDFPYVTNHAFLIDEHLIYALILLLLAAKAS